MRKDTMVKLHSALLVIPFLLVCFWIGKDFNKNTPEFFIFWLSVYLISQFLRFFVHYYHKHLHLARVFMASFLGFLLLAGSFLLAIEYCNLNGINYMKNSLWLKLLASCCFMYLLLIGLMVRGNWLICVISVCCSTFFDYINIYLIICKGIVMESVIAIDKKLKSVFERI